MKVVLAADIVEELFTMQKNPLKIHMISSVLKGLQCISI